MRLITYSSGPTGTARLGVRVGHRVLDVELASRVDGQPLPNTMKGLLREGRGALSRVRALAKAAQSSAGRYAGAMHEERAIRFLPPVPDAGKFLCLGTNYRSHLAEGKKHDRSKEMSDEVGVVKLNTSLVGHNAKVAKPAGVEHLDYRPELVFVIGKRALGVTADDDAMDYVVGVTILNGLTDRDMRKGEGTDAHGFGPLGPEIVTLDEIPDPYDLWMTCAVNGEERMRVNTGEHIWKITDILQHFSRSSPVEPGDMFSIGAPASAPAGKVANDPGLKVGDVLECSIEGVTTLRTTIVAP